MSKREKLRKWALKSTNVIASLMAIVAMQSAIASAVVTCTFCFHQPRVPESVKKLKEQQ